MNRFVTYERAAEGEPSAAPDRWRRRLLAALLLALLTAATVSDAHAKAEPLDPDEDVLFLPSTARQLEDGRIEVDLQAWIHEKDRHKILDAGLTRYLGLELSTMSPAARLRYAQRSSLFHAEPEEGTVLEIDFGQGTPHVLHALQQRGRAHPASHHGGGHSPIRALHPGCAFTLGCPARRGASKGARCWCRHRDSRSSPTSTTR